MSTYIYFTDAQKEQARQTDLVSLLKSQGETVKRSGREFEWKDGSQKVTIRGNLWYHQYEETGGDAIDFVRRFYNKSYPEAMKYLLGNCGGTIIVSLPIVKEAKPFELPPKNDNMRRSYAYLLNRCGIDKDVLNAFAYKQMICESEKYRNVVFVGYDQNGTPRHASMRGTGSESTYKGNIPSSQPEYRFHCTGTSRYLCLFEAPVDMLSFISIHKENWKSHSYAAVMFCVLGGITLLAHIYYFPSVVEKTGKSHERTRTSALFRSDLTPSRLRRCSASALEAMTGAEALKILASSPKAGRRNGQQSREPSQQRRMPCSDPGGGEIPMRLNA